MRGSRPLSSLRAWLIGLPTSCVSVIASASSSATTPARKRCTMARFSASGTRPQAGSAARAAAALAATLAASSAGSSASSAPVAGLWIFRVGMSVFHGAKAAPATHETGVAKRTPWSRLCRATGVAPLRGAPQALRGGSFRVRAWRARRRGSR